MKKKIFLTGHNGMVGSSIFRKLSEDPDNILITRSKSDLNLKIQQDVHDFFEKEKPDEVYLAAAKVGGIYANNIYPAEFIYDNLTIQNNVIHYAHKFGVKKLLFLGSSCIYPRYDNFNIAITENKLLDGKLEPTNEPYAIAKIAGIKLCESYNRQYGVDYRSVMPTNLYGPGDNYHPENSHVMPGLILRYHNAKMQNSEKVKVWGSGKPKREFLYVDDMAEASIYVMNLEEKIFKKNTSPMLSHINIGYGEDISINKLSLLVAKIIGFKGDTINDYEKPDGTYRKLLDSSLINRLGWSPKTNLEDGIKKAYKNFLKTNSKLNTKQW